MTAGLDEVRGPGPSQSTGLEGPDTASGFSGGGEDGVGAVVVAALEVIAVHAVLDLWVTVRRDFTPMAIDPIKF